MRDNSVTQLHTANSDDIKHTRVTKVTKSRLFLVMLIVILLFTCLLVRVAYLQFIDGPTLKQKAYEMQTRDRDITPRRGTIYDRTGTPLAISSTVYKITANPNALAANKNISSDEIASFLSQVLEMDREEVYEKIVKKASYVLVKRQVEKEVAEEIRTWRSEKEIEGVYIDEDSKRNYPNGSLASHVLGFTGADNQGLNGLELVYENYLKGTKGRVSSGVDASNKELPFDDENRVAAQNGYNLHLTIDESIQFYAEKALSKAIKEHKCKRGGTIIVSDPNTGDILALASKEDYDPNDPYACPQSNILNKDSWSGKTQKDVNYLNKTAWRNKAVADTYEPGSTAKAITAAIALEEGKVTPETTFSDAPAKVADRTIHCWKAGGHGTETFKEAMYHSCNPIMVQAGLRVGIDKYYEYMKAFGLTEKTGIDLPAEAIGSIHKDPTVLNLATTTFGQRFTVTPMQMIAAWGAIANGGTLMKPRLVTKITDDDGNVVKTNEPQEVRRVISEETSNTLRTILDGVVSTPTGTGKGAYIEGYNVAGKTGTSETLETESQGRYIASFAAFAPSDDPRICVLVILDHATGELGHGGGAIAAPVAKQIVEETLSYLEVPKNLSNSNSSGQELVSVPNLVGKTVGEAAKILNSKEYGLKYTVNGNSKVSEEDTKKVITEQIPIEGKKVSKRSKIVLTAE